MKIINSTDVKGPYPGKTWEALYAKTDALFPAMVPAKITEDECDFCMGKCSPKHTCCTKACWNALCQENHDDATAEARAS